MGRLPQARGCSAYRPRYRPGLPARESPGTPETWKQPLGTQERSEGPAGRLKQLPQAGHTGWALMSTHLFPTVSPWGMWKKWSCQQDISTGPPTSRTALSTLGLAKTTARHLRHPPVGPPRARCRKHWGPSRKPAVFPYT